MARCTLSAGFNGTMTGLGHLPACLLVVFGKEQPVLYIKQTSVWFGLRFPQTEKRTGFNLVPLPQPKTKSKFKNLTKPFNSNSLVRISI